MTLALFAHGKTARIALGDSADVLRRIPDASVDAIVTDPPSGIEFMGNEWDSNKGGRDQWIAWLAGIMRECLRVLKPGGHALVWALPRTSHWTGMAIEHAGFEIRDRIAHLFGQGFPKSLNVGKAIDERLGAERPVIAVASSDGYVRKPRLTAPGGKAKTKAQPVITAPGSPEAVAWEGWGTALKPACEDWWLARKPFKATVAENVLAHRTGALNIDACRIEGIAQPFGNGTARSGGILGKSKERGAWAPTPGRGRWPANVTLDEETARLLDDQSGHVKAGWTPSNRLTGLGYKSTSDNTLDGSAPWLKHDAGGASRFFYVAKAEEDDKTEGGAVDNEHETVKPVALMRWLVRLITPPGGLVLDPFAGSGTTGVACASEGMSFIGIEQDRKHHNTACRRLERWYGAVSTEVP